jgi:hypothetical protein
MYSYRLYRFRRWLQRSNGNLERINLLKVQQYVNALRDGKILWNEKASVVTIDRTFGMIASFLKYIYRLEIVKDIRQPKKQPILKISSQALRRNEKNRLFRK